MTPEPPPYFCKSCNNTCDNATKAIRMHPVINFWLCPKCWADMRPAERADLKLRLMELAEFRGFKSEMRDAIERRDEPEDPADAWKRGGE